LNGNRQRGFTLLELMISIVIGAIVVLAAVALASHEVRTLGTSSQVLEMSQGGRAVIDMIADDVTNAGSGLGYNINSEFQGVEPPPIGAGFPADQRPITLSEGGLTFTDDLVINVADGATASIVQVFPGAGFLICSPGPDEAVFGGSGAPERVIIRDAYGLAARSAILNVLNGSVACPDPNLCMAGEALLPGLGCSSVTITEELVGGWDSDMVGGMPGAAGDPVATPLSQFNHGMVIGNFRQVTWYVDANLGPGRLRRAVTGVDAACVLDVDSPTCGPIAAEGVESLQFAVFTQNAPGMAWARVPPGPITNFQPLRVDIELAMRSRTADINNQPHDPARLRLEAGQCIPGTCNSTTLRREVFRTSIEIKNSGYMRLNGGSS